MVVDELGGEPVLVTWCPVCGTAMVHRREIDGQPAVFGVQGALYRNAMTWWDHETGSIWSQPLGAAIAGPLTGTSVDLLPAVLTTWGAWRDAHANTLALDAAGGASGPALETLLIVANYGGEARGYSINGLREVGTVNEVLGGVPIAVVIDPTDPDRWAVYSRQVGDSLIELQVEGDTLIDVESGSTFDPRLGVGIDGPLQGVILEQLPAATSIPGFGPTRTPIFQTIWPDASVWWP